MKRVLISDVTYKDSFLQLYYSVNKINILSITTATDAGLFDLQRHAVVDETVSLRYVDRE